jgi:hypothetical protein
VALADRALLLFLKHGKSDDAVETNAGAAPGVVGYFYMVPVAYFFFPEKHTYFCLRSFRQ